MEGEKPKEGVLKYLLGLFIITGLRLMPRPPNFEPIMATAMPYSKGYGWLRGMVFSVMAIFLYDIVTHTWGPWSLITAPTYGLVSIGAFLYLRNKANKTKYYIRYAFVGTIFFDLVTGVGMGFFILKQSLIAVVVAQIPFTLMHLASSLVTACFSPYIYKFIVSNPDLSFQKIYGKLVLRV